MEQKNTNHTFTAGSEGVLFDRLRNKFLKIYKFFLKSNHRKLTEGPEAYSEPCQTSKMESFAKVNGFITIKLGGHDF